MSEAKPSEGNWQEEDDRPRLRPKLDAFLGFCCGGLLAGWLGSLAYASRWDFMCTYRHLQLGGRYVIHIWALVGIVADIVGILALLGMLAVHYLYPKWRKTEMLTWFVCVLAGVLDLASVIGICVLAAAGDNSAKALNDVWQDADFRLYLASHGGRLQLQEESWSALREDLVNLTFENESGNWSIGELWGEGVNGLSEVVDLSDFAQPYWDEWRGTTATVLSCAINFSALLLRVASAGPDPCFYKFVADDAEECLGRWSPQAFQRYWCYEYRRALANWEWNLSHAGDALAEAQHAAKEAHSLRAWMSLDGLSEARLSFGVLSAAAGLILIVALCLTGPGERRVDETARYSAWIVQRAEAERREVELRNTPLAPILEDD